MNKLLSKLWDKKARLAKDAKGFTLIELLVVVVILGVLIAIAIPLYLNYRKGANDASAQSDMRNAINVLEQCNTDGGAYPLTGFALTATGNPTAGCATKFINLSSNTSLTYIIGSTAGVSYMLIDSNTAGSGKSYCYNSAKGGSVATAAAANYAAAVTAAVCP